MKAERKPCALGTGDVGSGWRVFECPVVFFKACLRSVICIKNSYRSSIFFFLSKRTLMVTGGKLWWADEESAQLGTVTKRDGRNPVILRNKTSGVVHMKVYDREGQKGKQARMYQHTNR